MLKELQSRFPVSHREVDRSCAVQKHDVDLKFVGAEEQSLRAPQWEFENDEVEESAEEDDVIAKLMAMLEKYVAQLREDNQAKIEVLSIKRENARFDSLSSLPSLVCG